MCKESVPVMFTLISFFMLILLFALALTNMIISKLTPKEFETFLWHDIIHDYKDISIRTY
jgi:hypothetical protein